MSVHQRLLYLGLIEVLKLWHKDLDLTKESARAVYYATDSEPIKEAIDDFLDVHTKSNVVDMVITLESELAKP